MSSTSVGPVGGPSTEGLAAVSTSRLLACGAIAGPLFIVVAVIQILTRNGFDLTRLPISALSLGDLGWIQIANFVVTGLLTLAFAVGMRRVLQDGPGRRWGPLLVGIYGLGLVAAGIFVTDPGGGFPPGAPDEFPTQYSWHSTLHNLAAMLAFSSLVAACLVFARRFTALGSAGWAVYCAATALIVIALFAWPGSEGISLRLAVATVLTWAWTTAMAVHLTSRRDIPAGGYVLALNRARTTRPLNHRVRRIRNTGRTTMNTTTTVDEYLENLPQPLREIGMKLRPIIDAGLPEAACTMWHGHPTWKHDSTPVALLKAYTSYVTFGLFAGQSVNDPSGRLEPGARQMASVKLRSTADIDEGLFTDWLRQARATT